MHLPHFRRNLGSGAGGKEKHAMQRKSGIGSRVADLQLDQVAKAAARAVRQADNGYSRPIERFWAGCSTICTTATTRPTGSPHSIIRTRTAEAGGGGERFRKAPAANGERPLLAGSGWGCFRLSGPFARQRAALRHSGRTGRHNPAKTISCSCKCADDAEQTAKNWHPNWHPTDDNGRVFDGMVTELPNHLHVDFDYDRGLIGTIR